METMDYSDPEPNTNVKGGYVSPPPPPNRGWIFIPFSRNQQGLSLVFLFFFLVVCVGMLFVHSICLGQVGERSSSLMWNYLFYFVFVKRFVCGLDVDQ